MSNVPKLRFKEFSGEFIKGQISDFGYFYYGKSAPKTSVTKNATTPCIRYGELYSTYKEVIKEIKSHTNIPKENLKFSKGGEVLVPRVGEDPLDFANCCYLPFAGVAIGEMISVYNTTQNGIYITYYFNSKLKKQIARMVEGGNVSNLYFRYLEKIIINLPTKPEQEKIAAFLTSVDNRIEQLTKKESLLQQYKKGVMQKIFSQEIRFKADDGIDFPVWEEKKITSIANTSIGLVTTMTTHYVEEGVPLIRNSDIKVNKISKKNMIYLSHKFDEENKNRRLLKNDIVTVHTGEIGISSIINDDFNGAQGFATLNSRVKDLTEVLPEYLCWYYNSEKNIKYAISMATGDGRSNYNLKDFNNAKIPLPCLAEQNKIAEFLTSIDNKIEQTNQQLTATKQFKKALLQQMFM